MLLSRFGAAQDRHMFRQDEPAVILLIWQ
jgi:hypothetical protein